MKYLILIIFFSFNLLNLKAQSAKIDNTPKLQNSESSQKNNLKSSKSSENIVHSLSISNSVNNKTNTQNNNPALLNYNINNSDTIINNDSLKIKIKLEN